MTDPLLIAWEGPEVMSLGLQHEVPVTHHLTWPAPPGREWTLIDLIIPALNYRLAIKRLQN